MHSLVASVQLSNQSIDAALHHWLADNIAKHTRQDNIGQLCSQTGLVSIFLLIKIKIVMLINIMTEELIITEFNNGNLLTYQVTIENSRHIVTDHSDKISLRWGLELFGAR